MMNLVQNLNSELVTYDNWLDEIADLVFSESVKRRYFVMLAVYVDASTQVIKADNDRKIMCVAACLSSVSKWKRFERDWNRLLSKYGADFFHMTDFETYNKEYKSWTRERHDRFFKEAVLIMKKWISFSAASAVEIGVYERAQKANPQLTGLSPFMFCTVQCLQAISAREDTVGYHGPIHYLFEAGDRHGPEITEFFAQIGAEEWRRRRFRVKPKINGWSYVYKSSTHAVAAPDICAYENTKEMINHHVHGKRVRPLRKSALALWLGSNIDFRFHTEAGLANLELVQPS